MSLSSTTNRVVYQGNGSSTVFSFPYYFFNQTDLNVYLYDSTTGNIIGPQALNTDYSISGTANAQGIYPNGANVVTITCTAVSTTNVVITRSPLEVQDFVLQQNGLIPSTALTQQLDYLTLLIQRQNDLNARAVSLQDGFGGTFSPGLPAIVGSAISYAVLAVNSGGTGFYWQNAAGADAFGPAGLIYTGNGSSAQASFQPLNISASGLVTGVLSLSNGGTGGIAPQEWGIVYASSATQLATSNPGVPGLPLIANASSGPTFQAFTLAAGSGLLPNSLGSANTLFGVNAGASAYESKSITVTAAGTLTVPSGQQISLPNGSASAPAITFSASSLTNAGMYVTGSSSWGLSVGGQQALSAVLSSGGYGNIGFGTNGSLSDAFPFFVSRSLVGTLQVRIDNPDTNGGSGTKIQVFADNDSNQMEISAFTAATLSPDIYAGGRGVIRATGSLTGITLVADAAANSDIRVYPGGDASSNRVATFNSSGLVLGIPGTLSGALNISGSASGTVSILPQAAAGTYNFNLPTTAGTYGQVLVSGGGGGSSMIWATALTGSTIISTALGGTGTAQTLTQNQIMYSNSGSTIVALTTNSSASRGYLTQTQSGAPAWFLPTGLTTKIFTSGSTYVPSAGVTAIKVIIVGGGGGGGVPSASSNAAAAAGGSGGGTVIKYLTGSAIVASYPYVIGSGGPGGASGANAGQAGSSSIFASSVLASALIAGSGAGGPAGSDTVSFPTYNNGQPSGGTASNGDINMPGESGMLGVTLALGQGLGGYGGSSMYGVGGNGSQGTGVGLAGTGFGSGGGGSCQVNGGGAEAGPSGAAGVLIVEEFYA